MFTCGKQIWQGYSYTRDNNNNNQALVPKFLGLAIDPPQNSRVCHMYYITPFYSYTTDNPLFFGCVCVCVLEVIIIFFESTFKTFHL